VTWDRLTVRFDMAEVLLITNLSKKYNISMSEVIRRAFLFAVANGGFENELKELAALRLKQMELQAQIERSKWELRRRELYLNQKRILTRLAAKYNAEELKDIIESFNKELEIMNIKERHKLEEYLTHNEDNAKFTIEKITGGVEDGGDS